MSANEGDSAAIAWRRGVAATIKKSMRQNDHISGGRRRWNFGKGRSSTPADRLVERSGVPMPPKARLIRQFSQGKLRAGLPVARTA
jgi:hypothetical protein